MCHVFRTGGIDDCILNMLTHKKYYERTKMPLMTNKMSLCPHSFNKPSNADQSASDEHQIINNNYFSNIF
jgi:hypothetical protein